MPCWRPSSYVDARLLPGRTTRIKPLGRKDWSTQLQQIACEGAPYIPLWHDPAMLGWRSDRFAGRTQAPAGVVVDYNHLCDTCVELTLVAATPEADSGSGSPTTAKP